MLRKIARYAAATLLFCIGVVLVALCVFTAARLLRERRAAEEAAPNGRFVDAGDIRVFVQEAGPPGAPPILLVHGTGTWSEIWRESIDDLSADHRVIAVDLPPFGYSDKPVVPVAYTREAQARRLIRILDELKIERATAVGHSVGARPVVEAALEAPQRISRLILVDPALGFAKNSIDAPRFEQNRPSWPARAIFSTPWLRTAILSAYGTNPIFIPRMFRSFVSKKDAVNEHRIEVIRRPMVVKGTTAGYGAWLNILMIAEDRSASSDFANFKKLSMPVGIIWGRTDTVTPLWQGERLRELIPRSRLVILDGVGHIPYIEDPPAFIGALRTLMAD